MKYKYFTFFLFIFFFIYLILRSIFVPIVHDEAATYFHYIIHGEFLPWIAHQDANNHILNSALEIVSFKIFGNDVWALRLPNVLSFILFFYSSLKVSYFIRNKILQISFLIVLLCSQGFIDFFALARGYGISMAFLMLSIWIVLEIIKEWKNWKFALLIISSFLSLSANLTLLPTFLIIELFVVAVFIKHYFSKKSVRETILFIVNNLLYIIVLASFSYLGFKYQNSGALYYGSNLGLFDVTIISLSKLLFPPLQMSILFLVLSIILFSTFILLIRILKKKVYVFSNQNFFLVILFGNLCFTFLLNKFLGVHFPEDRTALYLYPLTIAFVFFVFDSLEWKHSYLLSIFFVFAPIHFLSSMNLSYSSHWKNENLKEETFQKVLSYSQKNNIQPSVGGYHIYRLIWSYYNLRNGSVLSQINPETFPNFSDDFLIANPESVQKLKEKYDVLDQNKISGIALLQRKKLSKLTELIKNNLPTQIHNSQEEYLNFIYDSVYIQKYKSIKARFTFELKSRENYSRCVLVVNTLDSMKNSIRYSYLELDWQGEKKPNQKYDLNISIPENHSSTKYLVAYIWNPKMKNISIENASLTLYYFE